MLCCIIYNYVNLCISWQNSFGFNNLSLLFGYGSLSLDFVQTLLFKKMEPRRFFLRSLSFSEPTTRCRVDARSSSLLTADWTKDGHLGNRTLSPSNLELRVSWSHSMTKNQSASTEFGQKTVIDKTKMKTAAVFPVGNYSLRQLCKSELPGNRRSKEGNAEAQSTQLWATWAQPYRPSDGSKLDFVAKSTLC